jgi:hypothetical protein
LTVYPSSGFPTCFSRRRSWGLVCCWNDRLERFRISRPGSFDPAGPFEVVSSWLGARYAEANPRLLLSRRTGSTSPTPLKRTNRPHQLGPMPNAFTPDHAKRSHA